MPVDSVIDAEYADAVDARLNSYDAYIEYQMREARRAIPFLSRFFDAQCARVLEVGAGHGGKGIAYARAGMRVVSLDVDVAALELGAEAARARNVMLQFLAGDGARLPFANDSFDAVLLDSVIEHVGDALALLRECARVLKRGGIAFVVFPPYYAPLSGHIDDYVMIPWFHLLPRRVVKNRLLSIKQHKGILSPRDAFDVYCTLNGLTIFRFKRIAQRAGFAFAYLRARPFLTHPGNRLAAGIVSALRPPRWQNLRAALVRARREFDLGTALLFVLLCAISPLVFVPILQEIAAGGCKVVLKKG
jgi:SAM-dependent methyltransferase